jgi:pyruvate dehydrogenase E1 component alpha subunit
MDVLAVRAVAEEAIARARTGGGPSFLVCNTYRYGGHHVGDKQDYKDDEEAKAWRLKDPIQRLGHRLIEFKLATEEKIAALQAEVDAEVRAAVDAAKKAPFPTEEDLRAYLYA